MIIELQRLNAIWWNQYKSLYMDFDMRETKLSGTNIEPAIIDIVSSLLWVYAINTNWLIRIIGHEYVHA